MFKAIIFDCFGVLVRDGWLPFLEAHFIVGSDDYDSVLSTNKRLDAGLIGFDDFITEVARLSNLPEKTVRAEVEDNPVDLGLFDLIGTLKPSYKIGMLSNAGADWLDELFTPDQLDLFDAINLSCETGYVKPDERAYEAIADRLGGGRATEMHLYRRPAEILYWCT